MTYLDGADQAQQAQHGGDGEVEDQGLADARGQLVVEVNYAEEEGGIVEQHKGAEGQRDLTVSGNSLARRSASAHVVKICGAPARRCAAK